MEGSTQKKMPATWAITVFVIGLCVSAVGVMFWILSPNHGNLTAEAEGVVTRVEVSEHHSRKRGTRYTYITYAEFEDSDHRLLEARSVVNGPTKRHYEGDSVTVSYDPQDPSGGCLIKGDEDRLAMFQFLDYFCRFGGPILAIVGLVAVLLTRKPVPVAS